jgi:site-specific DNA-methyltransferase (adenine-specific)
MVTRNEDGFLFYGDNLDLLGRYFLDGFVDLIYLDPPFKSDQTYNVLFTERDGTQAAAQLRAFGDTWQWDKGSEAACQAMIESGDQKVSQAIQALRQLLGTSDMMAYLAMMAPRLVELRRVLKPTGSIWLHCDSTAAHYLKILLDAVFGPDRFLSEVIWKRTSAHGDASRRFAAVHDTIFAYAQSERDEVEAVVSPLQRGVRGGTLRSSRP